MPRAFEKDRKKEGRQVKTVTKGPNKGKLISTGGPHPVIGSYPEHRGNKGKGGRKRS